MSHGGGESMDMRKSVERSQLHRLSQLDYLKGEYDRQKLSIEKSIGMDNMSMTEAVAVYMQRVTPAVVPKQKYDKGFEAGENLENITDERRRVVEVYQIANQRKQAIPENEAKKQEKKRLKMPVGSVGECNYSEEINIPESNYDKIDVNRFEGYLLYSYDKNGEHSILGEHIIPGSYGDRITDGGFGKKA